MNRMNTVLEHFLNQLHKFPESQWRIEKDPEGNWIIVQTVDRVLIYLINYMIEHNLTFLNRIGLIEYTKSDMGKIYFLLKN